MTSIYAGAQDVGFCGRGVYRIDHIGCFGGRGRVAVLGGDAHSLLGGAWLPLVLAVWAR